MKKISLLNSSKRTRYLVYAKDKVFYSLSSFAKCNNIGVGTITKLVHRKMQQRNTYNAVIAGIQVSIRRLE